MDPFQDDSESDEDPISLDAQDGEAVVLYGCGERKLSHPENHVTKVLIGPRDTDPAVFADDRPSEMSSGSANLAVISPFVSGDQYDRPQTAGKTVKQLAQAYLAVQQGKEEAYYVSPSLSRRFRSSGRSEVVSSSKNPFLTDSEAPDPAEVPTGACQVEASSPNTNLNLPSLNVETKDTVAPVPLTDFRTGAPDLLGGAPNRTAMPEVISPNAANPTQESSPVERTSSTIPAETTAQDLNNPIQHPIGPAKDPINPIQNPLNNPVQEPINHVQDPIIPGQTAIDSDQDPTHSTQYPINPAQYPVTPVQAPNNPAQYAVSSAQYPVNAQSQINSVQNPTNTSQDRIKPVQDSINSTQYPISPAQYTVIPVQAPISSAQYPVNAQNAINLGQDPVSLAIDPSNPVQNPNNPAQVPTKPAQPPTSPGQNPISSTEHPNPTQSPATSTPTPASPTQNRTNYAQEPTIPTLAPLIPTLNPSLNATSQINSSSIPPDVTLVSQDPSSSADPVPGDGMQSLQDAGLARIQILNAACHELLPIQETLTTPFLSSESSFHFPDPPRPAPLVCVPVKEVKFEEPVKHEIVTSQNNMLELGEIVPISVQPSHSVQNIHKAKNEEIFPTCTTTESTSKTKDESASQANSNPNSIISEAKMNHREQEVEEVEALDQTQDGSHEHSYGIIGNEDNMSEITLPPLGEHSHTDQESRPYNNGYPAHRIRISIDHQAETPSRKTMAITVLLVVLLPATIALLAAYKVLHKSPPG